MLMDAFEDFSESDVDDDDWDDRHIESEANSHSKRGIRSLFNRTNNNNNNNNNNNLQSSTKNYTPLSNPHTNNIGSSSSSSAINVAAAAAVASSSSTAHFNDSQEPIPLQDLNHNGSTTSLDAASSRSNLLLPGDQQPSASLQIPSNNTSDSSSSSSQSRESFFSRGLFSSWRSQQTAPRTLAFANQNDGVFSNMNAKPETEASRDSDVPPSYEEAAADATPLYWETTILAPGYSDEIFIDGLPVGSPINFIWNMMVSAAFQFVGFLLTYLLHTSHAAKQGARAGLGFTLFQYGFYLQPSLGHGSINPGNAKEFQPSNPNDYDVGSTNDNLRGSFHQATGIEEGGSSSPGASSSASDWISIVLMTLGFLIIVKSIFDYVRARKMENVIAQSPSNMVVIDTEDVDNMV